MNEPTITPTRQIIRTVLIAIITGISAALIVAFFGFCLDKMLGFAYSLGQRAWLVMPFAAAIFVGLFILRKNPFAGGEGMQYYITAVNLRDGKLSRKATILRFPATLLTLTMFGSGGVVGPLARICAGAGSWIVSNTVSRGPLGQRDDRSIGAICGVSGAISAIFHSPLAAGLYAAEVLKRESIRYTDLIVALLSAVTAYITSSIFLGEEPFFVIEAPRLELSAIQTSWLPVTAAAGGLTAMFFIYVIKQATNFFRKIPGKQPVQAIVAAVILSVAVYIGLEWSLRTSPELYRGLASGELHRIVSHPLFSISIALPFILIILTKIFLTSITIGCGMSAGFTGPLILIGMTLGALTSLAAGVDPTSAAYYGYMACGMAAVLSATLNIPLAAIALTMTVFGTSYILPAVTGSSIAFILFKGHAVYTYYGTTPSQESTGNDEERQTTT
jgi:CIC family chloride channel protein